MGRFAAILLLLAASADRPSLAVRASPTMSIANPGVGCSPVLLTAEIRGPEDEAWYCPRVEWAWPDGTVSATESDCPPFETRDRCVEPQAGCGLVGFHYEGNRLIEHRKECPCTIIGFPRRWTRRVCMPPTPTDNPWEIEVRLLRNGRVLARQTARVHVR